MGDHGSSYTSCALCGDVSRGFGPGNAALQSIGQRDRRVEVRSGDGAESENERYECGSGGDCVGEQGDGGIAAGQALTHDAGADDGADEEGCAEKLGCDSGAQGKFHR